ncbi:phospholipase D-like domain-containing protein [Chitinibacteraceae bacterium HSL-7]
MSFDRTVCQITDSSGNAATQAASASDWFALNNTPITPESQTTWGTVFSTPRPGNKVKFFHTGELYFSDVKTEIEQAKSSVFIAGWQINFDVELTPGTRLIDSLTKALKNGADVYILPWQNVPDVVETGALTTALAMALLNGTPGARGRARCITAQAQVDQGWGSIMFSHHQKSVIIDNKIAYCGGIDLAYGRRDDASFSIKAQGRKHNELYNTCIPAIHTPTRVEIQNCLTPLELLAAVGTKGITRRAATFFTSPSTGILAWAGDANEAISTSVSNKIENFQDWVASASIIDPLVNLIQDFGLETAHRTSAALEEEIKDRLKQYADTGGAFASNVSSAAVAWLAGQPLHNLPDATRRELNEIIKALHWVICMFVNDAAWTPQEAYERLFEATSRAVPMGARVLDPQTQPRMPWQDVQCRIEGPSVFDLSQNFTRRWNATATQLEDESGKYRTIISAVSSSDIVRKSIGRLLTSLGINLPSKLTLPRIKTQHLLQTPPPPNGGCTVQVMRSASKALLRLEAKASQRAEIPSAPQNNCLKAMLKAISSAQHFIYIEGQFFQSAYGSGGKVQTGLSGPMGTLLQLSRSPKYAQFRTVLGVRGSTASDILSSIKWDKVNDVMKMAGGPDFMADVHTVLKNLATREAITQPVSPQSALINPIGAALAERVKRVALKDGRPFHVYIVVPVHPEGTLDTLNIMSQVHLTMHSLVFGERSLINEVRRAILTKEMVMRERVPWCTAEARVNAMPINMVEELGGEKWQQYVTLLNLRNWDIIGGRPVTEQIYVHSKLLIADDQVAILGSANINDRSMLGDRDSELAVVITSENKVQAPIAGPMQSVAKEVHELRVALWKKHFGGHTPNRKAVDLLTDAILKSPGKPSTWTTIQKVALRNGIAYESAFMHIPRSHPSPQIQTGNQRKKPTASIWSTWHYNNLDDHSMSGRLVYRMPFDPLFWRGAEHRESTNSWNRPVESGRSHAPTSTPASIEGFIVALPTEWTRGEDNLFSKTHITTIAAIEQTDSGQSYAANELPQNEASA